MADIRQYMAWVERRIGALVVREGLHCGLVRVVQGPLVLTFTVRLLAPTPAALRRLLALGPALAQALQVESVRVADSAAGVQIEIPSPVKRTPPAAMLARHTRGLCVALGLDCMRQPVRVDLRQHGALLWVGPSRRGKTESMKTTVYALARANKWQALQYVILSQKRQDWAAFEPAAGCMGVVSDPAEAGQVLKWAAGEVLQGRAAHGGRSPALLVVADDLLNLLERAPDITGGLAEIASMGAGLGVHLLAGTQEAGSKRGTGGPAVESNVTARVVYKSSSAHAAARATGQGGAGVDLLTSARGDALLIVDGEPVRVATGWADDREILQLGQGCATVAPWRSATTHNRLQPAQPPQPAPIPPIESAHVGERGQGVSEPVATVAAVAAELFPIEKRAPTNEERSVIRELHSAGESLSALARLVYGHKDGKGFAWIKQAIEHGSAEPESEVQADMIDLSTEAGRRQFEAMQSAGLIRLPDVSHLFTTEGN